MEPITTPSHLVPVPKKQSSWGLLVGLLLILAIIVSSAYYAFNERINSQATVGVQM